MRILILLLLCFLIYSEAHWRFRGRGRGRGRGRVRGRGRGRGRGQHMDQLSCGDLQRAYTAWNDAYASGDLDALKELYTDNATLNPTFFVSIDGKEDIGQFYSRPRADNVTFTVTPLKITKKCDEGVVTRFTGLLDSQPISGVRIFTTDNEGGAKIELDIWNFDGNSP